jgi:hypothetical protein
MNAKWTGMARCGTTSPETVEEFARMALRSRRPADPRPMGSGRRTPRDRAVGYCKGDQTEPR